MNREEVSALQVSTQQTNERAAQAEQPAPDGYKWRVLATVIFGVFMIILDTTMVHVAFQALRQEFAIGLAKYGHTCLDPGNI